MEIPTVLDSAHQPRSNRISHMPKNNFSKGMIVGTIRGWEIEISKDWEIYIKYFCTSTTAISAAEYNTWIGKSIRKNLEPKPKIITIKFKHNIAKNPFWLSLILYHFYPNYKVYYRIYHTYMVAVGILQNLVMPKTSQNFNSKNSTLD